MIEKGEVPGKSKNRIMFPKLKLEGMTSNTISGWNNSNYQSSTVDQPLNITYQINQADSQFTTATKLMNSGLDEIPTLIHPFLPKVGIVGVVGSSDTGKSTFLRQLSYQIVCGEKTFLGFTINASYRRAIYVSTEDDEYAISVLLRKQFGNPNDPARTDRLKYIFETDNLLQKLDEEITKNPVDLVIIDAFSDLYGGDMNANNRVRNFLNSYLNLAKRHNCLIIFLHHTGKRTDSLAPGKDNVIGSQGFEAKMRLLIEIRRDPIFKNIRHLCIVKGNYLPDELKSHSIVTNFNEWMLFENLNCSIPFEALKKSNRSNVEVRNRALSLKQHENLSITEIHQKLISEGYKIGRSSVGEWLKGM